MKRSVQVIKEAGFSDHSDPVSKVPHDHIYDVDSFHIMQIKFKVCVSPDCVHSVSVQQSESDLLAAFCPFTEQKAPTEMK